MTSSLPVPSPVPSISFYFIFFQFFIFLLLETCNLFETWVVCAALPWWATAAAERAVQNPKMINGNTIKALLSWKKRLRSTLERNIWKRQIWHFNQSRKRDENRWTVGGIRWRRPPRYERWLVSMEHEGSCWTRARIYAHSGVPECAVCRQLDLNLSNTPEFSLFSQGEAGFPGYSGLPGVIGYPGNEGQQGLPGEKVTVELF